MVFIAPVYSSEHELCYHIASEINVGQWIDADDDPSVPQIIDTLRHLTGNLVIEFDEVLAALSRYVEFPLSMRKVSAPDIAMLDRNLASIEAALQRATALTRQLVENASKN